MEINDLYNLIPFAIFDAKGEYVGFVYGDELVASKTHYAVFIKRKCICVVSVYSGKIIKSTIYI